MNNNDLQYLLDSLVKTEDDIFDAIDQYINGGATLKIVSYHCTRIEEASAMLFNNSDQKARTRAHQQISESVLLIDLLVNLEKAFKKRMLLKEALLKWGSPTRLIQIDDNKQ